jgi:hypothetical protein
MGAYDNLEEWMAKSMGPYLGAPSSTERATVRSELAAMFDAIDVAFDVKSYGATGDGVADDTTAIQSAITAANTVGGGTVSVPAGTYLIGAITLQSNMTLLLEPGCTLLAAADLGATERLINFADGATQVSVIGYGSTITMAGQYTADEQRHGIDIRLSASRIHIAGVKVMECGGDGLYITEPADGVVKEVSVVDCWFDKNRRNGVSITGGTDIWLDKCTITDTGRGDSGGTAPQVGIDIEPTAGRACKGIRVTNCDINNNTSGGIIGSVATLSDAEEFSLTVENSILRHNMGTSIQLLALQNTHKGFGSVAIRDCQIHDSGYTGIGIRNWYNGSVPIHIDGCTITDVNILKSGTNYLKPGIAVYRAASDTDTWDCGNVKITNCHFFDSRAATWTQLFAYTSGSGTQPSVGDTAADDTAGTTGIVAAISVSSGTFAGGDAAGNITIRRPDGAFVQTNGCTFGNGATATIGAVTACGPMRWGVRGEDASSGGNIDDVFISDCTFNWPNQASYNAPAYLIVNSTNSKLRCNLAYAGDPSAALTASVGSVYRRTDGGAGTTLYMKESADNATGWAGM